MGSLRLSAKSFRRDWQNSLVAASPALVPGTHQSTSATLRSTVSDASTAAQSTGLVHSARSEAEGCGEGAAGSGGKSVKYCGSFSVIFLRIVRAPTSFLSEAIHTGTTLWASTS